MGLAMQLVVQLVTRLVTAPVWHMGGTTSAGEPCQLPPYEMHSLQAAEEAAKHHRAEQVAEQLPLDKQEVPLNKQACAWPGMLAAHAG